MEAAIKSTMTSIFEDYVYGLDKADASQFPIVLRDLKLKPAQINADLEDTPFVLDSGKIGLVKIAPGWGNVEVEVTGVKLQLSFSAYKAAKLAMKPSEPQYNTEEIFLTGAYAPQQQVPNPANVPPRYCPKHDTSDKRVKGEARECSCKSCGISFMSTYEQVVLCSMCSDMEKKCIICGAEALKTGEYCPAAVMGKGGNRSGGPPDKENREIPPAPTPKGGGSFRGSFRQDPYMNLQPTDSIPVMQGKGGGAVPLTPKTPPPPQRGPPPAQQRDQVARRAPPTQQVRNQRRDEDDDDENPLAKFLRKLNCGGVAGLFDDEDEEVPARPQARRPPPINRGPPPRQ